MQRAFILAISLLLATPLYTEANPLLLNSELSEELAINNRILANVNGKPISVVDITKKMDILFYRQFPQYASSVKARFQFYQVNWKYILNELVEKELILADAEEHKLPLSAGDVRQEMESLFGPNIIANLDKIGITFDEAYQIIQGDITLQRMLYIRVHAKALRSVTPLDVRNYYEEYAKANATADQWIYQTISFRSKNEAQAADTASKAYELLVHEKLALSELTQKLKALDSSNKTQVSISDTYQHDEKSVSAAYKATLENMPAGTYSTPVSQLSRNNKETVFRIFYLKEIIPGGQPPFISLENKLKNQLLDKITMAESKAYIERLRKHFDVQELVPPDFQPYVLQ